MVDVFADKDVEIFLGQVWDAYRLRRNHKRLWGDFCKLVNRPVFCDDFLCRVSLACWQDIDVASWGYNPVVLSLLFSNGGLFINPDFGKLGLDRGKFLVARDRLQALGIIDFLVFNGRGVVVWLRPEYFIDGVNKE